MITTEVVLSDGQPCSVRRLGIFELDSIGPELVGPFRYKFKLANGQEVEEEYDISRISTPPAHPGVPENEIVERSPQWWALLEWQTYKAAVEHERKRLQSVTTYVTEVSAYIAESCLSVEDRKRVVDLEDWKLIYNAALVPQLTPELLAEVFKKNFKAMFDGLDIFKALARTQKGSGEYNAIRAWEIQAMAQFGYQTEEEWSSLSLEERARKVAAINLPKIMESLEADKARKEMRNG
jgi:hypothetical protein